MGKRGEREREMEGWVRERKREEGREETEREGEREVRVGRGE